jgi:hypothetical protein
MEDVMFFHKTRPLATTFALAGAAMIIGTAAANAERRKAPDHYCNEGQDCPAPYAGIVQKERDGVTYFYGSSDKTFGYSSYQVLRLDIDYKSNAAPDEIMQPQEIMRYAPFGQSLRPWHKKWKHGHKGDELWLTPNIFNKSQFHDWNKVPYPMAP